VERATAFIEHCSGIEPVSGKYNPYRPVMSISKGFFSETPPAKTVAWILDHRSHSKSIPIDHRPEKKLGMML